MDSKEFTALAIAVILAITTMACTGIYWAYEKDIVAIKAGLVEGNAVGRQGTIWIKP